MRVSSSPRLLLLSSALSVFLLFSSAATKNGPSIFKTVQGFQHDLFIERLGEFAVHLAVTNTDIWGQWMMEYNPLVCKMLSAQYAPASRFNLPTYIIRMVYFDPIMQVLRYGLARLYMNDNLYESPTLNSFMPLEIVPPEMFARRSLGRQLCYKFQ